MSDTNQQRLRALIRERLPMAAETFESALREAYESGSAAMRDTTRDSLAAMAMNGMLANGRGIDRAEWESLARESYQVADALLAARIKET